MATFDASAEATATRAFVTHMQTQADAAIARLTAQATSWTYTALSAVSNLTLDPLAAASGAKPALTALSLPAFVAADFTALAAPVLPAAPSLAGGTTAMWSETFWTNLKSKLALFTDSITGADDIDSAIDKLSSDTTRLQSALYAKEYERKTQTLRDLYSMADATTGAAGFSHPNSMTNALKLDAQQKYQFDLSETSRTLIAGIFDWAKTNYQFSLQQGIAAHGADVEFNVRYLDTTVKVYSATVSALVEKYQADVTAAVSKAELKVKEFLTQYNNELEKHKTLKEIQLKEAAFDADVAKLNADITAESMKLEIQDFQARVKSFLDTAKLNLEDRDANVRNQIAASTAAAQAALALAAGASTITLNTGGA